MFGVCLEWEEMYQLTDICCMTIETKTKRVDLYSDAGTRKKKKKQTLVVICILSAKWKKDPSLFFIKLFCFSPEKKTPTKCMSTFVKQHYCADSLVKLSESIRLCCTVMQINQVETRLNLSRPDRCFPCRERLHWPSSVETARSSFCWGPLKPLRKHWRRDETFSGKFNFTFCEL